MADLAASLGMPLDEWQEYALEAAMGERADGRWVSKFVGISAPRQNGKSQIIVARALAGVLLFNEKMIIISAHETDTARTVWKRLLDLIEDNPSLEARVTGRMDAIGREFVSFGKGADKQTIKLKARQKSGARGFSADCLLLDEAQILGKSAWGSIVPTMSAMPNPQMWLFGTPPTPEDDPFAFTRVRISALGKKPRHAWLEWSAEPGDDFDKPETWAKANPSYGVRIGREACADDRAAMDDDQFALERLGMWPEAGATRESALPEWDTLAVPEPAQLLDGVLAVACDVEETRVTACWAETDAHPFVGINDARPWTERSAFAAHVADVQRRRNCEVVVRAKSTIIPALEQAGVRLTLADRDMRIQASSDLALAVQQSALKHGDYPELNAAVRASTWKTVDGRRVLVDLRGEVEATALALHLANRPNQASTYEDRGALML